MERVQQFVADVALVSPEFAEVVERVRERFRDVAPATTEDIKYGGIVFSLGGGLIAGVFAYKQHVSIEFSNGSQFVDPEDVLEGGGKYRRHLKVRRLDDLAARNLDEFIRQAVALSGAGG